ncbi:VOC family protein [Amycolatopsis endophytica]|uniref:Putative enzyme related to lactoylglutathione lyase n=1 Tax=Amycolatopsis endophytica TaxID=860233 RepID=A0A853B6E7_9PSEU|nr:VOC family protein [Amycolatopsis endophytica]NYI90382.1 putative enzyme related to lactoylglutathione lyase [Amycolatopsis endophytica]
MTSRLVSLVIDANRPRELAEFWAALLDWTITFEDHEEVDVEPPEEDGSDLEFVFGTVPEAKDPGRKNRVHLDLPSTSLEDQAAKVDRALSLGARKRDIGQGTVPWVVLADPEGNEFCVLEPRPGYTTTEAVAAIVVDTHDPLALATFWAEAAGWRIGNQEPVIVGLRAPTGRGPWLEFLRAGDTKTIKNRLHLDVAPFADGDTAAESARLCGLGAHRIDIGQRDVPWEVLADPEGNEFCVLSPR